MVEDLLTFERMVLLRFLRPESRYSAMARQMVEPFLDDLLGEDEGTLRPICKV